MALKKRLIPVLILRDAKVVQSVQFKHTNIIHWKPATAIDFFDKWAADELVVLDVSRDKSSRQAFYDVVLELSKKCFVPLSVGGWIDSPDEVRKILRLGADKVVINTEAFKRPELITECSRVFGNQCIVVSIDAKGTQESGWKVAIDRGRQVTEVDPMSWAKTAQQMGAGEIFLNCIERDGFRQGYDLSLVKQVVAAVTIPVIAMGGVLTWQHLVDGVLVGNADAVAAANIFHYTEFSTKKAKRFMIESGIPVRSSD